MEDINKVLEEIDKSFDKSKDMLKESIKKYYEFSVNLEKGLANDQVFKDFLKNSTDKQLEDKIDEMSKNVKLDPEKLLAGKNEEELKKAGFDAIMSAAIIKAIKAEQEKRKQSK